MLIFRNLICLFITFIISFFSNNSYADGLVDLNKALLKLDGNSFISATLKSAFTEKRGRKKKIKITNGLAHVQLLDNFNGLQITYSNELLMKLENEKTAKEHNEEANTPTLNAIDNIEASELRNMLSAASELNRSLIKAQFLKEESVIQDEENVRILHFNLPLEAIISDEDVRSYVNNFEGKYQIIIDKNGTPLQAKLNFKGNGSAYLFFKLSVNQSKTYLYKVINGRLVNYHIEYTKEQKSTWAKRESSGFNELIINEYVK
jgi:hypothetical protein